ncbi:MAG: chorismate-binding protein, partial [Actinomyces graevenitzii]|nr:chorismate-binding protein [Actinomyces graevenitzii]
SYLSSPLTLGATLEHLATRFATTWTFSVDGMIGASPEMLLQLREREVFSRVLAGTARRRANMDQGELEQLADWLRRSPKNSREHQLAAASAVKALTPITEQLRVSEPFALTLPNVIHLATDIYGQVAGDTGALALVEALHPTAAVCGTPTAAAAQLISELEGMDRERYAGPVGWVDWRGEGQWCIALRSGQVLSPTAQPTGTQGGPAGYPMGNQPVGSVRIFAGAGIMPDSVAADELAETNAKMAPMRAALGL